MGDFQTVLECVWRVFSQRFICLFGIVAVVIVIFIVIIVAGIVVVFVRGDVEAFSGSPLSIGVSKSPGAMVQTLIPNFASSLAIGKVIDTTPPLEAL